ncbi:hypothetical protein CMI38_02240 [Candidatus Pacearchaeota archaeon]|nr:hypothetical protein [Candidatus Pacearchaeota archaeon]|tara:strand:+ start:721 stop:1059 length:339 start_codon:yes stop_codon:yes gene_type:complete
MIKRTDIADALKPNNYELIPLSSENMNNIRTGSDYTYISDNTLVHGIVKKISGDVFTIRVGSKNKPIEHKVGESSGMFTNEENRHLYFEGYNKPEELTLVNFCLETLNTFSS